jgi:hypothetical protein
MASEESQLRAGILHILASLLEIGLLQLRPDKAAIQLKRGNAFAADACEWAVNQIALVTPKRDGAFDDIKLERAKVFFILPLSRYSDIQNSRLLNVHPHGACPLLPLIKGK